MYWVSRSLSSQFGETLSSHAIYITSAASVFMVFPTSIPFTECWLVFMKSVLHEGLNWLAIPFHYPTRVYEKFSRSSLGIPTARNLNHTVTKYDRRNKCVNNDSEAIIYQNFVSLWITVWKQQFAGTHQEVTRATHTNTPFNHQST